MARYNKSGLTVEQAQEIFDKCLKRGGQQVRISDGSLFGNWIIGSVGVNNAFYLFEENNGKINVSYSTNPKTGISKKLLGLAQKYGFIDNDPNEGRLSEILPSNSESKILYSVVKKMLPLFNNCCSFAEPNRNGIVEKEHLKNCPIFQKNNADFYLVSLYYEDGAIRIKYATESGLVYSLKLS